MTLRAAAPRAKQRWSGLLIVVGLGLIFAASTAFGTVSGDSGFEGADGNLAPVPTTGFDWNSFAPTTWTGTAPYRSAAKVVSGWTFTGIEDAQVTTSDTAFAGGTKQDNACPSVGTGKAPNKDDLKRIYIANKTVNNKTYLALGWVRIPQNTTSASAHVAFEFNQNQTLCGAGSDGLVTRSTANGGDMLIVYDFEGSSTDTPAIKLSRWIGSGACEVGSNSPPCWGNTQVLTDLGFAEGKVNTSDVGSVTDTIGPITPQNLGNNEFGEAIIDLTSAGVIDPTNPTSCISFGRVFGVSRSSGQSSQAQMKDLVGPGDISITNCATVIIHKVTVPSPDTTTDFNYTKNFTTDPTSIATFTLKDGETKTYSGSVFPKIDATVIESDPSPQYALTSITCTAASTATGISTNLTTRTLEFDIASGQLLECTFTNTRQKVQSSLDTDPWIYPNDDATVDAGTGETNVTGSVTFKLYGGATAAAALTNCQANAATGLLYSETVNLPAATGTSKTVSTSNPGTTGNPTSVKVESDATVYWRVSYSGDARHFGRLSNCSENIAVDVTDGEDGDNVP
jgi:hypothetical protein